MSEEQLYDLVVTGHSSQVKVADLVKDLMVILQKKSPQLEYKLTEALIFKDNANSALDRVSLAVAEEHQKKFAVLSVLSEIRPTIDIVPTEEQSPDPSKIKIYTCPACHHEQPKVTNRLDMCDQCGVIGEKYANTNRLKMMMEEEKLLIAQAQALNVRESLAKADLEEKHRLRKEARRRLGIYDGRAAWLKFAAVGVGVVALGIGAFYGAGAVNQYYLKSREEADIIQKAASDIDLKNSKQSLGGQSAAMPAAQNQNINLSTNQIMAASGAGNGKMSTSDVAIALLDNGLLPDAPAYTINNIEEVRQRLANGKVENRITNSTTTSKQGASKKTKMTHGGRGMEILYTLERSKLAYPLFQRETGQFMADYLYVVNLLKQQRRELVDIFIETLTNPYEQALLYIERDSNKKIPSKDLLTKLQTLYNDAQTIEDKSLLMGAASGMVQKAGNEKGAEKLINNSIKLASSLKELPARLQLLSRLANEQYLLNEHDAAINILTLMEQQLGTMVPEQKEPLLAKMAASYFVMGDQANALRLSEHIANPKIRQTLFQTMQEQQVVINQVIQ